jgi:A/G-specific adenine glycosylase
MNSALMDLGATVCSARAPKCLLCPLEPACVAAPVDAAALSNAPAHSKRRVSVRFEQTTRYLRGRIVDALRPLKHGESLSLDQVHEAIIALQPARTRDEVSVASFALARDGLIAFDGARLALPSH